ncbi:MAG: hypothetical protein Q8O18_09010, partial [Deltaproteobacteria bacterium]|nr:hypothetical protein [Deltaproteobacteria bacterium]
GAAGDHIQGGHRHMTRKVLLYIKDILQNMEDAEEFIRGISYREALDRANPAGLRGWVGMSRTYLVTKLLS